MKSDDLEHTNEESESTAPRETKSLGGDSLLPLGQSLALAGLYMSLSIAFFLLIRHSKATGATYDSTAAVLGMEICKCVMSIVWYYTRTRRFLPKVIVETGSWRVGMYFAVPSMIYAVYNNLTYFNLTRYDPATFQVFMQTRVLFTGFLYQVMLHRRLSKRKWLALVLLAIGVALKYVTPTMHVEVTILVLLVQAALSSFAGVYNEFLLKRDLHADVNEQNFFMYSCAIVFNLILGLILNPSYYLSGKWMHELHGVFLAIVLIGATMGLVTSLILKYINVIVKAFASACEVLLTAVAAAIFLRDPLTLQDGIACVVVMCSMYVYYTN